MLPSGMDGLERAALTEKSQGDASRRPGRRSFSAPAGGGGGGGVGGGVSSWHLLTPSALALWKFIVAVVVVRSCCAALKKRDSVSLDVLFNFQRWENAAKQGLWNVHEQKMGLCEEKKEKAEARDWPVAAGRLFPH